VRGQSSNLHTPPKNPPPFHGCKHTSLAFLVGEFSDFSCTVFSEVRTGYVRLASCVVREVLERGGDQNEHLPHQDTASH
jgi:hypothetical protein